MLMNTPQKISLGFFVGLCILWIALFCTHTVEGFYNYLFSFLFGLVPLISGIVAMRGSKMWGGLKTAIGKAVFYIGLGIFLWGCGETIWSYYNFALGIPAPYPSLADLGFAPSIFFYGMGAVYLSKATGAKFGFRNNYAKVFVAVTPVAILALSYYTLVTIARGGVLVPEGETTLKMILDIIYPLGDFLGLTIATIISGLSFKYMGGRHTLDTVSILLGLAVMFAADFIFSYTTTVGTYYNADFGDLILATGVFFLSYGILGFSKLKEA
jgi:hypothetical protein